MRNEVARILSVNGGILSPDQTKIQIGISPDKSFSLTYRINPTDYAGSRISPNCGLVKQGGAITKPKASKGIATKV